LSVAATLATRRGSKQESTQDIRKARDNEKGWRGMNSQQHIKVILLEIAKKDEQRWL